MGRAERSQSPTRPKTRGQVVTCRTEIVHKNSGPSVARTEGTAERAVDCLQTTKDRETLSPVHGNTDGVWPRPSGSGGALVGRGAATAVAAAAP
eukprot:CAMPEP_0204518660 /NCGR_PEP_ID=MMETSP0661-20131031/4318_1 /ASSEMBLY_ACC=CAM_ASM_000606 /TAXON_ID=109239 /ORGANISM="Alexandrium margalefi, Strain AMGDE01CS-322" /LENGTH=93 /DNA_ID=CAMNT_0051524117 /DNA_START=141 /DNA_END=418 /DNA_ORIENTATION=+